MVLRSAQIGAGGFLQPAVSVVFVLNAKQLCIVGAKVQLPGEELLAVVFIIDAGELLPIAVEQHGALQQAVAIVLVLCLQQVSALAVFQQL